MIKICLIGGIFLVGEHKRTHETDMLVKPLILTGNPTSPFALLPDDPEEVDVSRADLSYPAKKNVSELYLKAISQIVVPDSKIVMVN
ncbi:MAG: hypothetical protein WC332_00445 [Clostridia bacterium]|jgi:hypothetical protein